MELLYFGINAPKNRTFRMSLRDTSVVEQLIGHANNPAAVQALATLSNHRAYRHKIATYRLAIVNYALTPETVRSIFCLLANITKLNQRVADEVRMKESEAVLHYLAIASDLRDTGLTILCRHLAAVSASHAELLAHQIVANACFCQQVQTKTPIAITLLNFVLTRNAKLRQPVAQTHGSFFTKDWTSMNSGIRAVVGKICSHLDPNIYDPSLLKAPFLPEKLMVAAHFAKFRAWDMITDPNWSAFENWVARHLEDFLTSKTTTRDATAAVLLLQVLVVDINALSSFTVATLASYLERFPMEFRFSKCEDIASVNRVLDVAQALKLPEHIQATWKTERNYLQTQQKRMERLNQLGIETLKQPDAFHCPVTLEVMRDPVVASDGHTYERATLTELLRRKAKSPMTREPLDPTVIVDNIALKKRIREFVDDVCDEVERFKKQK